MQKSLWVLNITFKSSVFSLIWFDADMWFVFCTRLWNRQHTRYIQCVCVCIKKVSEVCVLRLTQRVYSIMLQGDHTNKATVYKHIRSNCTSERIYGFPVFHNSSFPPLSPSSKISNDSAFIPERNKYANLTNLAPIKQDCVYFLHDIHIQ